MNDNSASRVLDVGTGTGIWAIDYAQLFPLSRVIGIDLSPIQPSYIPPNLQFLVDDLDDEWDFTEKFQYIHCRMMNSAIRSWPSFLRQCFNNSVPKGYLEIQDINILPPSDDNTLHKDMNLYIAFQRLDEATKTLGSSFQDIGDIKHLMREAGFRDIKEKFYKWPSNLWNNEQEQADTLGVLSHTVINTGLEGFLLAPLTRGLDWSQEAVQMLAAQARLDLKNQGIHAYWLW